MQPRFLITTIASLAGIALACRSRIRSTSVPSPTSIPTIADSTKTQESKTHPTQLHPASVDWTTRYTTGPVRYELLDSITLTDLNTQPRTEHQSIRTLTYELTLESSDSSTSIHGRVSTPALPTLLVKAHTTPFGLTLDTTENQDCSTHLLDYSNLNLSNILPAPEAIPLTTGAKWKRSTSFTICLETIPVVLSVISSYTVTSHFPKDGRELAQIQRRDSITASGAGASGSHHASVTAIGSATANIDFDPKLGRTTRASVNQNIHWQIQASKQTYSLQQSSRQLLTLLND